jgi:GNAT superfamily N-acetyltransferase
LCPKNILLFQIVECEHKKVAAFASSSHYITHLILNNLLAVPNWRKQGIGSYLVQTFVSESTNPLYLQGSEHRISFYTRMGFVQVPLRQIPQPIDVI